MLPPNESRPIRLGQTSYGSRVHTAWELSMSISRIIFEHGVELSNTRNSLKIDVNGLSLVEIFQAVQSKYSVRPILLTEVVRSTGGGTRERHSVLTLGGLDQLNLRLSLLHLPQGLSEAQYIGLLSPSLNVQHTAGAIIYHCQQLALAYTRICDNAHEIILGEGEQEDLSFGNQSEPYYEVEALITASRRTYDALRYILWKSFGPGGKDTPSNFLKTLAACEKIPYALRVLLADSWERYGKKMTAYRDCIQHYVPVTYHLQTATMKQISGSVWTVTLRIPNNPEKKSQKAFDFSDNLDALTYCWELADEVFRVAAEVFTSIPKQKV
jgi:hypothetical protein